MLLTVRAFLKSFEGIPKGVSLCLRRICDADENIGKHSTRNYKPDKEKK